MKIKALLVVALFVFLGSCKSTNNTVKANDSEEKTDTNTITNLRTDLTLADYLRRVSGVSVRGSGLNATVVIRSGANSLTANPKPLFLIDGTEFFGSFAELSSLIPVQDIKTVRVYKNASEISRYGVKGANGVIDIRLK
ncbi:MAG: hypothetical protein COA50_05480 [Flavobacteriaceae bacterium]|nr:MAG: hypothetical protein COA50_05480 [Flavobacteriaceae bacterium]